MRPHFFLFTLLLGTAFHALGQSPSLWQLTDAQGLPSMTIYQIIQDQQGFIWLGTQRGLHKYDGRTFHAYEHAELLDREIIVVEKDPWGRIWFNNLSGQIGWVENDTVQILDQAELPGNLTPKRFSWIDEQLFVYHPKETKFGYTKISFDKLGGFKDFQPIKGEIGRVGEKKTFKWEDQILVGIFMTKDSGKEIRYHAIESDSLHDYQYSLGTLPSLPQHSAFEVSPMIGLDSLLLYYPRGVSLYKLNKGHRKLPGLPSQVIVNNAVFIDHELFILTNGNGVFVFDSHRNQVRHSFLDGVSINTAFKDKEQNLWLGTTGQGLYIIPSFDFQLYNVRNNGLPRNEVYSIYPSPKTKILYAGLSDGLLVQFSPHQKQGEVAKLPPLGRITSIIEDSVRGGLWLSCDVGISRYLPLQKHGYHIKNSSTTKHIAFSNDGSMWIAGPSQVSKIDNWQENNLEQKIRDQENHILLERTYALYPQNERMWIGTTQGIYSHENDSLYAFLEEAQHNRYHINSIGGKGASVWIGTARNGLLQIQDGYIINRYNNNNGLSSNNVTSIHVDTAFVFVGTDQGVDILNLATGKWTIVNELDGLPAREVNAVSYQDSIIWAATNKGLVSFPLKALRKNLIPPAIVFSDLQINGRDTSVENHYDLSYQQNTLEISFASPCYRAQRGEKYKYRLSGLKEEWEQTSNRSVRFHALSPGHYQFEVFGQNEDNTESTHPAKISFHIKTPWWKSIWFYFTLIIGVITIISGIAYWRQRDLYQRMIIERDLKEKIQSLRMDALRAQMNPHFIYNALNAIQDYILTERTDEALHYLSSFAQLTRLIFDFSGKSLISLEDELIFLNLYLELEQLRFGDRVNIEFFIPPSLSNNAFEYQLPPLLIQPIIENAFKHGLMHKVGNNGQLLVKIETDDVQYLKCIVQDNGVGRDYINQLKNRRLVTKKSGSLTIVRKRLDIYKSTRTDQDIHSALTITDLFEGGTPSGTRVELII